MQEPRFQVERSKMWKKQMKGEIKHAGWLRLLPEKTYEKSHTEYGKSGDNSVCGFNVSPRVPREIDYEIMSKYLKLDPETSDLTIIRVIKVRTGYRCKDIRGMVVSKWKTKLTS